MSGFFGGGSSVDLASPSAIGSTTPNTGAFTTLSATPSANSTPFTASGYSLTGANAQSLFDLSGTWNTSGTPTAIKLNVTDTASNASSLLMDLQVGGSSKTTIRKDGAIRVPVLTGVNASFGTSDTYGIRVEGDRVNVIAGSDIAIFRSSELRLVSALPLNWNQDTYLYRDAANTLAQRNSTNAQTFRLYRTYTDASNYERLGFLATNTTRYTITSQNAGTGSARSLEVSFYTSASDPTSTDITSGCFSVWKNSGTSIIKLWANDGGTMKSVALA
jgi:hypothetical protein